MELWIRSQDKQLLQKINNGIMYYEDNDKRSCVANIESEKGISIVGAYLTKERAVEVLDEIQNKLLKSKYDKASEDYGKHSDCKNTLIEISSSTYVYEMPKE